MNIQMRSTLNSLVNPLENEARTARNWKDSQKEDTFRWGINVTHTAFHQNDSEEDAISEVVRVFSRALTSNKSPKHSTKEISSMLETVNNISA